MGTDSRSDRPNLRANGAVTSRRQQVPFRVGSSPLNGSSMTVLRSFEKDSGRLKSAWRPGHIARPKVPRRTAQVWSSGPRTSVKQASSLT